MENKHKISPEEYRKILSGVNLISITLKESNTFLNTDIKFSTDIGVDIKNESSFEILENGIVHIFQKYTLDARKERSKSRFIKIVVTFQVNLKSKEEFTKEFFEIYKNVSLNLNTWPYLREFVNDTTARMNIPPLTLPFYKV